MKKYAYMKSLFSSMVIVISVYGAVQFYNSSFVEQADAKTYTDIMQEEEQTESCVQESSEAETALENFQSEPVLKGVQPELEIQDLPSETESAAQIPEKTIAADETQNFGQAAQTVSRELFDDALFIGDSRTVGLMEYGDLGEAEVFAGTGMTVFETEKAAVKTASGRKQTLQEVLQSRSFGKVYIMLGLNELGYPQSSIIKRYRNLVEEIRRMQPDAMIFLQANLHVSQKKSASSDIYNNEKINQLNEEIKKIAEEFGLYYLDVNPLFDDETGSLDKNYTSDDAHVLGKYYDSWTEWILKKTAEILNQ
ncbi:MAG: GDSL-type esterase/lipase family protein [Lachnospiraceae bacterium]